MLEMLVAGANGTCCKLYELQLFSAAITCYKLGCGCEKYFKAY